jgi:hypothetical protein
MLIAHVYSLKDICVFFVPEYPDARATGKKRESKKGGNESPAEKLAREAIRKMPRMR